MDKMQTQFYESWMYQNLTRFDDSNKSFGRVNIVVKKGAEFARDFFKDYKATETTYETDYLKVNSWNL